MLTEEAVQHLKKMDILRLERNHRREERRKGGGEDVSEDEEEAFAPYLVVVPSGGVPFTIESPEAPAPTSKLLFDDAVASKNTFQANDNSIPSAIFFLVKNGISPSLTLFLPESLARIRSSNVKTVKHGTGESTKVTVIDVADFPDEDSLDQATWFTSYNTFLTFMELACGPQILQGFAAHYNQILTDPHLAQWYPGYRDFDKRIRARFFTEPFIVDVKNHEYRDALQSAKNSFLMISRATLVWGNDISTIANCRRTVIYQAPFVRGKSDISNHRVFGTSVHRVGGELAFVVVTVHSDQQCNVI